MATRARQNSGPSTSATEKSKTARTRKSTKQSEAALHPKAEKTTAESKPRQRRSTPAKKAAASPGKSAAAKAPATKASPRTASRSDIMVGEAVSDKLAHGAHFRIRLYRTKSQRFSANLALVDHKADGVLWQAQTDACAYDQTLDRIEGLDVGAGIDLYAEHATSDTKAEPAVIGVLQQARRAEARAVYADLVGAMLYEMVSAELAEDSVD